MLDATTKRRIDAARDILVGKIPDPKSQVEQITLALTYKFMDDMDAQTEELGGQRDFFAGEFARYGWAKLLHSGLGGQEKLNLYGEAIARMPENPGLPPLFRAIFRNAYLPYRDPETLNLFLQTIDEFTYGDSENLGDAYEYLLAVLGVQGDAGQFRTPRHIIDFIVAAVDPQKTDTILDPACGTGGFLISAWQHIRRANADAQGKDTLTPEERSRLAANLRGYDISPDFVRLSLVNMYLHGFKDPQIVEYDTLTDQQRWHDYADVIITNPPFMSPKGGIRPHNRFAVQSKRSEVLFVDYVAEHLTAHGRAGVIVPEGIIFQTGSTYKQLRKRLVDDYLAAVISLPGGVFQPYSGVKTSILLLDKSLAARADTVAFFKVEQDGFDLGAQRRPTDRNDLPTVAAELAEYRKRAGESLEGFSPQTGLVVDKAKLAAGGDYNLIGERYRENGSRPTIWPTASLGHLEDEHKIEFLRGQGLSKKDLAIDGKNPCILYGELYTLYDPFIDSVVSRTDQDGKVLSVAGDVLIPSTTTADAMGIAIARSLNTDNIVLGADINIVRTRNRFIDAKFLALLINFPLKGKLASYAKGANILHLSNKDIRQLEIPLPPLHIQQEIVAEVEGYQEEIRNYELEIDRRGKRISKAANRVYCGE